MQCPFFIPDQAYRSNRHDTVSRLLSVSLGLLLCLEIAAADTLSVVGDCFAEAVAVEPGVNQYQYDSFSPDGKLLAIAWDSEAGDRGTYLLNLDSGERDSIEMFNNGAAMLGLWRRFCPPKFIPRSSSGKRRAAPRSGRNPDANT